MQKNKGAAIEKPLFVVKGYFEIYSYFSDHGDRSAFSIHQQLNLTLNLMAGKYY